MVTTLQQTQVQFPVPMASNSQSFDTPAPKDLTPSGLCEHTHTHAHTQVLIFPSYSSEFVTQQ